MSQIESAAADAAIRVEGLVDALDHIRRTVLSSRTQTRRMRWVVKRAEYALDNRPWDGADVPVNDPLIEALRAMIVKITPLIERALAALLDEFADEHGNIDAAEAEVQADATAMRAFLDEGQRNVPDLFRREANHDRDH